MSLGRVSMAKGRDDGCSCQVPTWPTMVKPEGSSSCSSSGSIELIISSASLQNVEGAP